MLKEGQTVKVALVFSVVETGEVISTLEIPAGHFTCKEERGFSCHYHEEKGRHGKPISIEPNGYQRGQLQWWAKGTSYDDFETDIKDKRKT